MGLHRLAKLHGLEQRWGLEHWNAKAHYNFVENLHSETARSLGVQSAGRPGPNVTVRLDPTVAGHRDLHRARACLTDAIRDSYPY